MRLDDRGALALLLLAVLAVFGQSAGFAFLTLDDHHYVVENPKVWAGLGREQLSWALTTTFYGLWHPLAWLSHMLDAALFGTWAGGHHLSSVLFHALASVFLYRFFREAGGSETRSLVVALLFAIHPLHVESVAWVSERKDVLCGLFWILAMVAHGRYARAPSIRGYLWTALWVALALMSKPMAVTLPAALLLLDVWPLRRWPGNARGLAALARLVLEKLPLVLLVVGYFTLFLMQPVAEKEVLPLDIRLANVGLAYWTYLYQTLWPLALSSYYPMVMDAAPWVAPLTLGVLLALALGSWAAVRRRPWLPVGLCWYLGTLVPVIGFVPVAAHAHADRYTYIPLIGVFAALVWAWPSAGRGWRGAGVAALLLGLCALAFVQARTWRDNETLYSHAIALDARNFFAHQFLAEEYLRQGRLEEARAHATKAISLAEGQDLEYAIWMIYGDIQMARGEPQQALRLYERARGADPRRPNAFEGLADAQLALGAHGEAAANYGRALQRNPTSATALAGLGQVALARGAREDARRYLDLARAAYPANVAALERSIALARGLDEQALAAALLARGLQFYPRSAVLRALQAASGEG